VPEAAVAEYLSVLGEPAALEAAIAWYRAAGSLAREGVGPVAAPTLYLWGDRDHTVGPTAARFTAEFVRGPYRFEVVPGVGHFITDEAPDVVTEHLLAHLRANG
jgi:pimeloyl-ACP methyl ester carboxylesterase